ncbi:MAG TPA: isoprenylcysteine carboxylmethyltransferase family protein [Candidatus Bathyarchaeia archaeon]|nr:isoprenylcysteine carboxylmethyltransferase family protein [Candidatus Bathyarchaeia archaeon]
MVVSPVFASGFGLVLFDSTYFVWIVSELFGSTLIPRLRQRGARRVKRDRGSVVLIIATIFLSVYIAFYFGYAGIGMLPDWTFYLGIFLTFLGIMVRQVSIAILGRFFSTTVQIVEDHKVVEKGPYRLVRHPSYTGVLITFIGLGLAVQSLGALLALLVLFTVAFGYRIWVEERALLSGLGQDYASYMKRTKRLIPFLI